MLKTAKFQEILALQKIGNLGIFLFRIS